MYLHVAMYVHVYVCINNILQRLEPSGVSYVSFQYIFLVLFGKFVTTWKAYNSSKKWCNQSLEMGLST